MSNYSALKAAIQSAVYTNGNNEITGAGLQSVLLQIVNTVGDCYVFKGVATPGTSAGTPDANVFYIAPAGTYTNFGSSYKVDYGKIGIFTYNGSWVKESINIVDITQQIYNVSARPISDTANKVRTKTDAVGAINTWLQNIGYKDYIAPTGVVLSYWDGETNHYCRYVGNGVSTPDNWVEFTVNGFPFKSNEMYYRLENIRRAIKGLYIDGQVVTGLKVLMLRNYGVNGATNTDFIIGTGTSNSNVTFYWRFNFGQVRMSGIQTHSLSNGYGSASVLIDWDAVDYNYYALYSDKYLVSESVYTKAGNPLYIGRANSLIIVDASGGGDYTSLQDAIDGANDSAQNPVTIIVMPGTYIMGEAHTRDVGHNRYLSIVGTDKNNCIVRNDVGFYQAGEYIDNSCLKMSGNCYIANLTIISTIDNYPLSAPSDRHKAYCIHVDFDAPEGAVLEINNCVMRNDHFSCVGFGLRKNFTLKIVNCELTSTMYDDDATGYGTIYGHDGSNGSTTDRNQYLMIKGCVIENTNSDYAVRYLQAYGNLVEATYINNVAVSQGATYAASVQLQKSNKCFGNNVSLMN